MAYEISVCLVFFLMIPRPPRSTQSRSSAASDVYKRQVLGAFPEEEMESLDLVVMSPGVPTDLPVVLAMKEKGIPVWGEIELAYVCGKGDVLGITGTNGKTTTTSLLGEIMKNARDSVFVVGTIATCVLYISDAAADLHSVKSGGRRSNKTKKPTTT